MPTVRCLCTRICTGKFGEVQFSVHIAVQPNQLTIITINQLSIICFLRKGAEYAECVSTASEVQCEDSNGFKANTSIWSRVWDPPKHSFHTRKWILDRTQGCPSSGFPQQMLSFVLWKPLSHLLWSHMFLNNQHNFLDFTCFASFENCRWSGSSSASIAQQWLFLVWTLWRGIHRFSLHCRDQSDTNPIET